MRPLTPTCRPLLSWLRRCLMVLCLWPQVGLAGELTRAPELVGFVEAPHPDGLEGQTATVTLAVQIGATGKVQGVEVVESAGPAFDAAALAAVRQFEFLPAEIDGKPAAVRILYRYAFVEKVELPTTATLSGQVKNREGKAPLPGIQIQLSTGQSVETDAEGRFEIRELAPGTVSVTISGPNLTPVNTEESLAGGERLEAIYEVFLNAEGEEGDDLEILVSAPTLKRQAVSVEIGAEEARKVPGTQGDVLRVVENLPGVARSATGAGSLVVWGAAPEDTGVYIDGVRVPRLYHDGGLRSVLASDFVKSVELVPGGYGAAYGRGLGGLVVVDTPDFGEKKGVHGTLAADLYDSSVNLQAAGEGAWNGAVGARVSYLAPALSAVAPDVEDLFPIPHYQDAQARLGWDLAGARRLELTGLVSRDQTARTAPNADPSREASEVRTLNFSRIFLRYVADHGDGHQTNGVLYVGEDESERESAYGAVTTAARSFTRMIGLRLSSRHRILESLTLEGGLDGEVDRIVVSREGSTAIPSREGDLRAFGQPPPDQISADEFVVYTLNAAPYVESDLGLWKDRLHVIGGLRVDPYIRSVSRSAPQEGLSPTQGLYASDFQREPRLQVRLAPTEHFYWMAAWGRYGQQPQALDLSASFGNPALPIATGTHRVTGFGLSPEEEFTLDLTGFYTDGTGIVTRNPSDQPARAEALVAELESRSYGMQCLARFQGQERWFGWVSYTLSWSERRLMDSDQWRFSDYDQRHVLTSLAGVNLPYQFEVGARGRIATGAPRTEVVGSVYDIRRDLYQPVFGEQNQIRLPTFFQADLRVAKTFDIERSKLEISFELQNLTNRKNVEEFTYAVDYSQRGSITGLPMLPVIGLRWTL
jgi:TonB family protein